MVLDLPGAYIGHIGQMHAQGAAAKFPAQLAHGLKERQRLDVTYHTAYFGDYEVEFAGIAQGFYVALYLIGDMRHNLHRLAQIIATALLSIYALIDASGGNIVGGVWSGCR